MFYVLYVLHGECLLFHKKATKGKLVRTALDVNEHLGLSECNRTKIRSCELVCLMLLKWSTLREQLDNIRRPFGSSCMNRMLRTWTAFMRWPLPSWDRPSYLYCYWLRVFYWRFSRSIRGILSRNSTGVEMSVSLSASVSNRISHFMTLTRSFKRTGIDRDTQGTRVPAEAVSCLTSTKNQ